MVMQDAAISSCCYCTGKVLFTRYIMTVSDKVPVCVCVCVRSGVLILILALHQCRCLGFQLLFVLLVQKYPIVKKKRKEKKEGITAEITPDLLWMGRNLECSITEYCLCCFFCP